MTFVLVLGMRSLRRWVPAILLGLAVAGAVTGLVLTRAVKAEPGVEAGAAAPASGPGPAAAPAPAAQAGKAAGKAGKSTSPRRRREWVVDETPVATARTLQGLAGAPEEKEFSRRALRLANHEVDLAYTDAVTTAAQTPPPDTPEVKAALAHKAKLQAEVKADQERIAELAKKAAAAPDGSQDAQLEMAKAQLELDQDELDEASEALERVGGDPQARIRRLQAAHSAADAAPSEGAAVPARFQASSLLGKLEAWNRAQAKVDLIDKARQAAQGKVQTLVKRREVRAKRVEEDRQARQDAKETAAGLAQGLVGKEDARAAAQSTIASLRYFMLDQKILADLGRRIQDQQDLADVYDDWGALARTQARAALHVLIRWLTAVLGVLVLVYLADRLFERHFRRRTEANRRVGRLVKVLQFGALAVGVLAILGILFGPPSQLTTLFGLAGAGLTVALKDFILAFIGWFVLVGRKGIHVGDWVEIKGVGGEVVEIGVLRTLLMETGSWTDAGHPTGRIVSFVNSFALEGHFFNFSTSGQWMWDELRLSVPPGQDPYPLLQAIQERVERETGANARLAEEEWHQSARGRRLEGFSARPGINLVPSGSGVEIHIRYITRAYERHQTRKVLNEAVVEELHKALTGAGPAA
jgi:small-conductance mechanosensitive channel